MRPIQLILVLSTLGLLAVYFARFRSQLRDRVLSLVFFVLTIAAIAAPDFVTQIANRFGVGRGTDFVFYVFAMSALFTGVLFYNKLSRIERNLTRLARAIAIESAKKPKA